MANVHNDPSCYVARYRGCNCAYAVIVEGRGREREVCEFVTNAIRDGDVIDRMSIDDFRANVELLPDSCPAGGKH